jgi:two-component system, OmpR family, sensor histidine kinase KdpD
VVETSAGEPVPTRPEDAQLSVPLDGQSTLVLSGPGFGPEDLPVLEAFTGQLALAVERRRLRAEAAMTEGLAEANELRTALLAAVSHDLRTPLASIKAAVSGLLQRDVEWSPESTRELLMTVDDETDRLNALVGNLLDMSRIQTGSLEQVSQAVGLEEVVPRALTGFGDDAGRLIVEIPETLPRVKADPALLERTVANLVANALAWSPDDLPVRVTAGEVLDHVDLRVVDYGPGIPAEQRERIFLPFQRLGDRSQGNGVGLGLAVAKGFVEAMAGDLVVEDTPGGGTTMAVSLPAA